jgi:hypothetical protein
MSKHIGDLQVSAVRVGHPGGCLPSDGAGQLAGGAPWRWHEAPHGLPPSLWLQPGDTLAMKGPFPKYPYKPNMKTQIGMVAGGSGITPMLQVSGGRPPGERGERHDTHPAHRRRHTGLCPPCCQAQQPP